MADFERIKSIDKSIKLSVHGYFRQSKALFPSDNPYYNLPQLVIFWILLYFEEPELFEINRSKVYQYDTCRDDDGFRIYGTRICARKDNINEYKWTVRTTKPFEGMYGLINITNKDAKWFRKGWLYGVIFTTTRS